MDGLFVMLVFLADQILMFTLGRFVKRRTPYKVERVVLPLLHLSPAFFGVCGLFLGSLWIPRWPFYIMGAFAFLVFVGVLNLVRILNDQPAYELNFGPPALRLVRWGTIALALIWGGSRLFDYFETGF